jgi:expansin (peptidoglycan-binding protein)
MKRPLHLSLAALALALALGALGTAVGQSQQRRAFLPMVVTNGGAQTPAFSGEATYYDTADGGGNCMFDPIPGDLMVAAIAYLNYGNPEPETKPGDGPAAVYCGAYAEVTGPNGTIVVRIVDKCPDIYIPPSLGCNTNHLDLSPAAFAKIAPLSRGRVPITWRIISPELGRPIAYKINKDANQWWTAIQVRYHRNPIRKLEYRDGAGQWVSMLRTDYNYFIGANMGPGPYTLRVTDAYGNVLEDTGVTLTPGAEINGRAQFPKGP